MIEEEEEEEEEDCAMDIGRPAAGSEAFSEADSHSLYIV